MPKAKHILLGLNDANGEEVRIDIETLLRSRMFISASSGGGKSETVRRLCEQLFDAGIQVIVVDRESEYSTLREKRGFVLVGPEGETPAHPHTAKQVALTLLKTGASAILDIYELDHHPMHQFVANFINGIMSAPKDLWRPVVILIDEAHEFAPEKGFGESIALNPVMSLCSKGRKRSFCPILVTQRAAKVSKNCTEPLQNFLIGMTMPDDQARICSMFKIAPGATTREFSTELENLNPGQFFVRGRAISKDIIKTDIHRADTKAPAVGKQAKRRKIPTPASLRKLLPALADIPKEAEITYNNEKEMRTRIRELEKEVRELKAGAPKVKAAPESTAPSERERMLTQQLAAAHKTATAYEKVMDGIGRMADSVMEQASRIKAQIEEAKGQAVAAKAAASVPSKASTPPKSAPTPHKPVLALERPSKPAIVARDGESLTTPEQRVLDAIRWMEDIGICEPEQTAVAFLAGYSMNSSSFKNPRGALKRKGMIDFGSSGGLVLTQDGRAAANAPDIEPTNRSLQGAVLGKLPTPEKKLLNPLLAVYPEGLTSAALAEESGYSADSSSFKNPRGRLNAFKLTEIRAGKIYARPVLFPEGK